MNYLALDSQELKTRCPAIFATAPDAKVSPNYQFVPTHEVLRILEDDGWRIKSATQQRTRDDRDTSKHMISMLHPDFAVQARDLGGLKPQVRIVNSHDWSSKLQIMIGMFRLVCTNGLMVSAGDVLNYNVRHDRITEDTRTVMARIQSGSNRLVSTASAWDAIKLDDSQVMEFGRQAADLRFPGREGSERDSLARELVSPRRDIDAENTLWNVYNRAQESGMTGGFRVSRRRARPISNIAATVDFNQKLWEAAERFSLAV